MTRYALIESNSGLVWYIGDHETPEAACVAAAWDTGAIHATAREISESESRTTAGHYEVHEVPPGFEAVAGEEDKVEEHPFVGYYRTSEIEVTQ